MPSQIQDTGPRFVNTSPATLTFDQPATAGATLLLIVTSRNQLLAQTDPSLTSWTIDAQYQPFTNNPGVTVFRKTAAGGEASVTIEFSNALVWRLVEYSDFEVSSVDVKTATGGDSIDVTTVALSTVTGNYAVGAVGVRTWSGTINWNNSAALNQQSDTDQNPISHGSFHGTNPAAQLNPSWATAGRTNAAVVGYTFTAPVAGDTLRPIAFVEQDGWDGAVTDVDEETLDVGDYAEAVQPDAALLVVRSAAVADQTRIPTLHFVASDPDDAGSRVVPVLYEDYVDDTDRGSIVASGDPIVLTATEIEYTLEGPAIADGNYHVGFIADAETQRFLSQPGDLIARRGDAAVAVTVTSGGYDTPPTLTATLVGGGALPSGVSAVDNGDGTITVTHTHATVGVWDIEVAADDGLSVTYNYTVTAGPPTVDAGPDATISLGGTFTRTAVENDNGSTITSRRWYVKEGPAQVGQTLDTDATLSFAPTAAGVYRLAYEATNGIGTTEDAMLLDAEGVSPVLTAPPRDHLTEQQVLDSLAWQHSTDLRWGVDLLNTVTFADTGIALDFTAGQVSWQWRAQPNPGDAPTVATVRRQCDLTFRHIAGFNPLSVYYRPYVEMRGPDGGWVRWWLGVFVGTLPGYQYDGLSDEGGPVVWRSIQLADISHVWQADETADPVVVAQGTDIIQWVRDDIATRFDVFDNSNITGTGTASIDYVFDVGTTFLDIYSTLLSAVGNTPLYANADGLPESAPLVDPAAQPADITYPFGSTVVPTATVESVNPDLPNTVRFVARRGPSLAEEGNGIRTVVNESVGPGSLQQRGGRTVLQTVEVDAQTQTELDAHARGWAPFYFAGGGLRYVGSVALDPRHGDQTIVQLERPPMGLSGTWLGTAWTIQLGSASDMATMSVELEQLTGTAFVAVDPPVLGAAGTFTAGYAMAGGAP